MKMVRSGLTSAWLAQHAQIMLPASTGMRNKNITPELLARTQRVCCRVRIQLALFPSAACERIALPDWIQLTQNGNKSKPPTLLE